MNAVHQTSLIRSAPAAIPLKLNKECVLMHQLTQTYCLSGCAREYEGLDRLRPSDDTKPPPRASFSLPPMTTTTTTTTTTTVFVYKLCRVRSIPLSSSRPRSMIPLSLFTSLSLSPFSIQGCNSPFNDCCDRPLMVIYITAISSHLGRGGGVSIPSFRSPNSNFLDA
jgi:hypothetical protein